jgi:hypothetical protein
MFYFVRSTDSEGKSAHTLIEAPSLAATPHLFNKHFPDRTIQSICRYAEDNPILEISLLQSQPSLGETH